MPTTTYEMPVNVLADLMGRSEQQVKDGQVFPQDEMELLAASWR